MLEGGRILAALGLAAVAAVGLALATTFAVLAVDRGDAGYFAGLVLSLALMGALSRLLFGISPSDPLTLGSVLAIGRVVTTLATLIPASRAACVLPMRALREE